MQYDKNLKMTFIIKKIYFNYKILLYKTKNDIPIFLS